jgi:hypothetical protein
MAFNPFSGWTEAELLTAKRAVQDEMMAGGQITGGGSGGTSFTKAPQYSAMTRYNWILAALNALNPTTYPLANMMPTSQRPSFFNESRQYYPNI